MTLVLSVTSVATGLYIAGIFLTWVLALVYIAKTFDGVDDFIFLGAMSLGVATLWPALVPVGGIMRAVWLWTHPRERAEPQERAGGGGAW